MAQEKTLNDLLQRLQSYSGAQLGLVPSDLCGQILAKISPDLSFLAIADIAGEAFVIKARDQIRGTVAVKIALPSVFGASSERRSGRINYGLSVLHGKDITEENILRKRFIEGCNVHAQLYKAFEADGCTRLVIPKVFDRRQEPCLHCLMEWVENISIVRWLAEKGDFIYSLERYADLLAGMAHVHDYQIIHRDIKPRNIGITDKHRLCLFDWTISKRLNRDLTAPGVPMGTFPYAAPEAIEDARSASYPADIFGLGFVLWAFTNRREILIPEGIDLREESEFLPFRKVLSQEMPDILKPIFLRATEWDVDRRYQIIPEMLDDFIPALEEIRKHAETYRAHAGSKVNVVIQQAAGLEERIEAIEKTLTGYEDEILALKKTLAKIEQKAQEPPTAADCPFIRFETEMKKQLED